MGWRVPHQQIMAGLAVADNPTPEVYYRLGDGIA